LPFPLVVFVGNAVGTILLTWVLMPIVTRLLNWWLNPAASREQTIGGVVLLLAIYVVEVLFFVWVFRTFGF
jgi:CBS domain containing-hemolysin-like protein